MTRVLVAYATKMNGTKGIAEAIGDELTAHGLTVEVRNVREADSPDYYDAVVLGSGVYAGRWRPEAKHWFNQHADELSRHPVWVFESGWVGRKPPAISPTPGAVKRAARIGAEPPTVFGGRLDPTLATGPFDRMLAKRMSGDARDFDEIRAWAGKVADALTAAPAQG